MNNEPFHIYFEERKKENRPEREQECYTLDAYLLWKKYKIRETSERHWLSLSLISIIRIRLEINKNFV